MLHGLARLLLLVCCAAPALALPGKLHKHHRKHSHRLGAPVLERREPLDLELFKTLIGERTAPYSKPPITLGKDADGKRIFPGGASGAFPDGIIFKGGASDDDRVSDNDILKVLTGLCAYIGSWPSRFEESLGKGYVFGCTAAHGTTLLRTQRTRLTAASPPFAPRRQISRQRCRKFSWARGREARSHDCLRPTTAAELNCRCYRGRTCRGTPSSRCVRASKCRVADTSRIHDAKLIV